MSRATKTKQSRGTKWGHHVYAVYRQCPRRYLFSEVFQFESKNGSINMEKGSAWAAWLEVFNMTENVTKAMQAAKKHIAEAGQRYPNLAEPSAVAEIMEQVELFAKYHPSWMAEWVRQKGTIKFLATEEESNCPIQSADGADVCPYTVRQDALCEWANSHWIWECKVSGFTFDRLLKMHRLGGQISGYVHDRLSHGKLCAGGLLYHARTGVKDPAKLFNMKPILRPTYIIENWRKSIRAAWEQMEASRKLAVEGEVADAALESAYPQNFNECVGPIYECSFADACSTPNLKAAREVLETFCQKKEDT